jgi:hypothetical protein
VFSARCGFRAPALPVGYERRVRACHEASGARRGERKGERERRSEERIPAHARMRRSCRRVGLWVRLVNCRLVTTPVNTLLGPMLFAPPNSSHGWGAPRAHLPFTSAFFIDSGLAGPGIPGGPRASLIFCDVALLPPPAPAACLLGPSRASLDCAGGAGRVGEASGSLVTVNAEVNSEVKSLCGMILEGSRG